MAYFDCIVGGSGKSEKGNTLVVTCTDDLAGATITCTNGIKTYTKTCPSTSPYEVTFYGLEAGTWTVSTTVSGSTYTTTVVITDYEAELGGFNWKTWVDLSQNYNSSDFTDLDDLLSDETAVRELMTIHACVDYLAGIAAESADVETIIGNDLCAKWINLSDYALDTLSANPVIKALMDVSNKELKGQVPKMTSNTAPYGEVYSDYSNSNTYKAFDGDATTLGSTELVINESATAEFYIGYKNVKAYKANRFYVLSDLINLNFWRINTCKIYGTNDISDTSSWIELASFSNVVNGYYDFQNDNEYTTYIAKFNVTNLRNDQHYSARISELQFYAYEYSSKYFLGEWALVGQVPTMTSNTAPYGVASASSSYGTSREAWNAFDSESNPITKGWTSAYQESTPWLQYKFIEAECIKKVHVTLGKISLAHDIQFKIQVSNNGSDFVDVSDVITITQNSGNVVDALDVDIDTNGDSYLYYRMQFLTTIMPTSTSANFCIFKLQFYAWAPKGNVPMMTSNTAPYGNVLVSSALYSGSVGYSAFDGNDSSMTISAVNASTFYLGYKFVNPIKVARLRLYVGDGSVTQYGQYAYSFNVQASNDGSNWSLLKSVSGTDGSEIIVDIPSEKQDYYLYYRLAEIKHKNNVANVSMYFNYIGTLQFYGRELKVSVPTMTSNTAPYGEASASGESSATYQAYKVFDKNEDTFWVSTSNANQFVGYKFNSPICVRYVQIGAWSSQYQPPLKNFKIQYSNDGANYTDVYTGIVPTTASTKGNLASFSFDNEISALYWRVFCIDSYTPQYDIQFSTLQFYGLDYSEKEFEEGTTKKWLYDHGVELETIATFAKGQSEARKEFDHLFLRLKSSGESTGVEFKVSDLDLTNYSLLRGRIGKEAYSSLNNNSSGFPCVFALYDQSEQSLASYVYYLTQNPNSAVGIDISSINQIAIATIHNGGGTTTLDIYCTISEWWLE